LIEQNKDKKLLLILGQAAQGKSTLAASYVHNLEIPSAWVNLSEEDSDPVNLFYSMALSLQHVLNDVDLSPVLSYPSVSMGPRLEIPLYREWINAIFERISVPIQIVLDGLDIALNGNKGSRVYKKKVDGDFEAHLIALSCTEPPEGFSRWSLRLLADRVIELEYIDNISHETIRRILKKTSSNPGSIKGG